MLIQTVQSIPSPDLHAGYYEVGGGKSDGRRAVFDFLLDYAQVTLRGFRVETCGRDRLVTS